MSNESYRRQLLARLRAVIALLFVISGMALLPQLLAQAPLATAAPSRPLYSPTATLLPPPAQPLLARNVAPDGTVYVLDAFLAVYALAPRTLTPLARSARLGTPNLYIKPRRE